MSVNRDKSRGSLIINIEGSRVIFPLLCVNVFCNGLPVKKIRTSLHIYVTCKSHGLLCKKSILMMFCFNRVNRVLRYVINYFLEISKI